MIRKVEQGGGDEVPEVPGDAADEVTAAVADLLREEPVDADGRCGYCDHSEAGGETHADYGNHGADCPWVRARIAWTRAGLPLDELPNREGGVSA